MEKVQEQEYEYILQEVDGFDEYSDVETIEIEPLEYEKEEDVVIEKEKFQDILKKFFKRYCENKKSGALETSVLLQVLLKEELSDKSNEEIEEISKSLITSVEEAEGRSLKSKKYSKLGIKASDYLGKEIEEAVVVLDNPKEVLEEVSDIFEKNNKAGTYGIGISKSIGEVAGKIHGINQVNQYVDKITETIAAGNQNLLNEILTKSGEISRNTNLDGFIFEHHHANTFNIDAATKNISNVKAVALTPEPGFSYGKNSVDVVIKKIDNLGNSSIVRKYQAKLSSTAESAQALYDKGNYYFQSKLFGKGQESHGKTKIEYNGVESQGLTKSDAKEIQREIQSGKIDAGNQSFINDVDVKILSKQIGKQAIYAGGIALVAGTGLSLLNQVVQGEEIDGKEVLQDGLKSGASAGISTMVAGAIKVGVEKQLFNPKICKFLSKSGVIGTIAFSSFEIVSTFYKVGEGEYTFKEGVVETGRILASTYAGCISAGVASAAVVGLLTVGSVVAAVAAPVAGTIGFFLGSQATSAIYNGAKEIVNSVYEGVKSVASAGIEVVNSVCRGVVTVANAGVSAVKAVGSAIASFGRSFGRLFGF